MIGVLIAIGSCLCILLIFIEQARVLLWIGDLDTAKVKLKRELLSRQQKL
jgi:hypothetical protein